MKHLPSWVRPVWHSQLAGESSFVYEVNRLHLGFWWFRFRHHQNWLRDFTQIYFSEEKPTSTSYETMR